MMLHKSTLPLLLLLPFLSSAVEVTVSVRGILKCHGQPFKFEKVELYEKNLIGADTRMVSMETDASGAFAMKATVSEWPIFYPNPYIYFPNYCVIPVQIGDYQCANTIKVFLPSEFVTDGHIPAGVFDIGEIELENVETEKQGLGKIVYSVFKHKECRTAPKKN